MTVEEAGVFADERSKKLLLVAHCILNQNAKLDRCAHYPGAIREVTETIVASGVGIVQMPCPDLLLLGLARQAANTGCPTIEEVDTRIARRMAETAGITLCQEIVRNLVYQIEEYRKNGFEIVGIVGINGSPTCGVETTWAEGQERPGYGVLTRALSQELAGRGAAIPLRGIKAFQAEQALVIVTGLLRVVHAQ
jgi:predicted secreted protein